MTGLCVAEAPDESCWFILQDFFLRCRLWFYVPVMTVESFLFWSVKINKMDFDYFQFWKILNTESSGNTESWIELSMRLCKGAQMNNSDASKLHIRELLCAVREGFFFFFFEGKIQPKNTLSLFLNRPFLVMYFSIFGVHIYFILMDTNVRTLSFSRAFLSFMDCAVSQSSLLVICFVHSLVTSGKPFQSQ